jgi:hypothetical protein
MDRIFFRYSVWFMIAVVSAGLAATSSHGAAMAGNVYIAHGKVLTIDWEKGHMTIAETSRPPGKRLPMEGLREKIRPVTADKRFYFKNTALMEKELSAEKIFVLSTVDIFYRVADGKKVVFDLRRSE